MNTILTSTKILRESVRVLKNTLSMARAVNREYSAEFSTTGAKWGQTINIRKPARYLGRSGQAAKLEGTQQSTIALPLSTQFGVDLPFSMAERTLSLDKFSDNVIKPAMATIANKIDDDLCALGEQISNAVGTPGTVPVTLSTYLDAGALLSELGCPRDNDRYCMLTPKAHSGIVGATATLGLFNPSAAIAEQYRTGLLAQFGGFKFYEDQNQPTHTVGALGGTPLVNGASQVGSSLVTDGWTAAAATRVKKGDVFAVAGVYSVNPQNRRSTTVLQQFTATADAASDGSGNMTIPISPAIVPAGQFQNVNATAADNAGLTFAGTAATAYRYGLAFHKDFAAIGFADLELPRGTHEADRVSDADSGISLSFISDYDVMSGQMITRIECLYGITVIYPELACRIWQ